MSRTLTTAAIVLLPTLAAAQQPLMGTEQLFTLPYPAPHASADPRIFASLLISQPNLLGQRFVLNAGAEFDLADSSGAQGHAFDTDFRFYDANGFQVFALPHFNFGGDDNAGICGSAATGGPSHYNNSTCWPTGPMLYPSVLPPASVTFVSDVAWDSSAPQPVTITSLSPVGIPFFAPEPAPLALVIGGFAALALAAKRYSV